MLTKKKKGKKKKKEPTGKSLDRERKKNRFFFEPNNALFLRFLI